MLIITTQDFIQSSAVWSRCSIRPLGEVEIQWKLFNSDFVSWCQDLEWQFFWQKEKLALDYINLYHIKLLCDIKQQK